MRIIDADLFLKSISTMSDLKMNGVTIAGAVAKCATIDAVPVVRCRECIHRYTEDCPMYFHSSYWHEGYEEYVDDDTDHTEDNYFCPKGKRREGAN